MQAAGTERLVLGSRSTTKKAPHVQGFLKVELAGLEPATSWVR